MDFSLVLKVVRDCLRVDRIAYPRAKILTVAHDNDRSLWRAGKWYSPLVDTIEDDLRKHGVECVSIARIISRIKGDAAYGRVYSPEGAFARAMVAKRLRALVGGGAYAYSRMEEAIWSEILELTGARKVFGIQPSRELCVACRKRGIWVADVQHGVISHSHPWYGERFRGSEPPEYLPDSFLCWDHGSGQAVEWATAKGVRVEVIGNRWLARFRRRRPDDTLVGELFDEYQAARTNPAGAPAILLSLSWGGHGIPNGFIPEPLMEAIRGTSRLYRWFVRLHPNQMQGFATHEGPKFERFYRTHLEGMVEWRVTTQSALPLVLSHTDLHISWQSSVAIEAAQMGIQSALLDPRLLAAGARSDFYEYYRRAGLVHLVDNDSAAIARWLAEHVRNPKRPEAYDAFDASYRRLIDFLVA